MRIALLGIVMAVVVGCGPAEEFTEPESVTVSREALSAPLQAFINARNNFYGALAAYGSVPFDCAATAPKIQAAQVAYDAWLGEVAAINAISWSSLPPAEAQLQSQYTQLFLQDNATLNASSAQYNSWLSYCRQRDLR